MDLSELPPIDSRDLVAMDAIFPPPAKPSDLGRGPLMIGIIWTFSALAIIITGVRIWLRISVLETKLLIEDWLILLASVSMLLEYYEIVILQNHQSDWGLCS
jgi:hypothetical protein